ncbi:D-inositol-3-phosphate glycosyltransferase [Gemmata obscuriglobus]|uniref:Glycosyl transferase family 1 domain-containing protein n=1 Tax=Gemmata obscuriglobus TaxID=114 RepID=A0A2Z3H1N0_9BACT|nr:glycosyltransferase [Gemmata obscuriglobus]AWM38242.1 hypothetical protein C1280_15435 [Gemmata obscuriglobus]QEG28853.1 D-inositol-3-phosphate glycosyltransferase [Gemmata obscuriglobus]VTS07277.1 glycosyltransferase : Mannosyl transferase OS=Blastopirellula marina DSM 3645 GN=DSM3645_06554 PE=4 SV=1: Glycos_transf_1: Glycos_transf_1 [Gemmata obscuriglobus UQM 2246]
MFRLGVWLAYGTRLTPESGSGVFTYELIRALLRTDPPVELTVLTRPGDHDAVTASAGGPHPRLTVRSHILGEKSLPFALARECDAWLLPATVAGPHNHVPTVVWVSDGAAQEAARPPRPSIEFLGGEEPTVAALLHSATACVCLSAGTANRVLRDGLGLSPAKLRVVRPALPADFAPPSAPPPRPSDRPYLFWPAAFRASKNHAALITALHRLGERYGERGFDLVLTGDEPGHLPDGLRALVDSYGLGDRVRVLGPVPRIELARLYACAFATVIPSAPAQGPFPLYESLASGCPVACSNVPSLAEHARTLGDAVPYFDPADPDSIARAVLRVRDDRSEVLARQRAAAAPLWDRTWADVAREVLDVCRESAAIATIPPAERAARCARPWPDRPPLSATPVGAPELLLFLPVVYPGGVWQATKDLLTDLVDINRRAGRLALTFALPDHEGDHTVLRALRPALPIDRFDFAPITRLEAARLIGPAAGELPERVYGFFKGCPEHALRADAWFALADRFRFPLLPVRPYGVLVYDMIQRHAPETFPEWFFEWSERGMAPTVERADLVLTASESTRSDVVRSYAVDPNKVRMVPIAGAPARRFAAVTPEPVALPREPFLLQVTNIAPHKGIRVMLRGYAELKKRLGADTPLLVVCGYGTEMIAPTSQERIEDPNLRVVRRLFAELGLREGQDVAPLGFVNDAQLCDLYQRAAVVVNAARYDNGTLCAIEGRYFGRPVVSSAYPAAEEMARRFDLPVHFFPVEDAVGLADRLAGALAERPLTGADLSDARKHLDRPEFAHRRYAEGVYELLVELAERGRSRHTGA